MPAKKKPAAAAPADLSDRAPRTRAEVTPARRRALDAGEVASRTLVEILVTDFGALLRAACPDLPRQAHERMDAARGAGIIQRMELGGVLLARHAPRRLRELAQHPSDTVRGWVAYAVTRGPEPAPAAPGAPAPGAPPSLDRVLDAIRPLAADTHSGVREWAWIAARPAVARELDRALALLQPWTLDADDNIRRFASEITRPRGVWCAHLEPLKRDPTPGLVLLEPLRADPARYVQNSVANWLNDAGKSRPDVVRAVLERWTRGDVHGGGRGRGSDTVAPATAYIARRAARSFKAE
jgi:3-methyladenine DNA glycosylase AlkC